MENQQVRLEALEDHAVKTEGRLAQVELSLKDHGNKLDAIQTTLSSVSLAITRFDAQPRFNPASVIGSARDVFAILAVCAGFALWYVTTLTATSDKLLERDIQHNRELRERDNKYILGRVEWLEQKLNWRPNIEPPKATP